MSVGDPFAEHLARTTEPVETRIEGAPALRMPSDPALRRLAADRDA